MTTPITKRAQVELIVYCLSSSCVIEVLTVCRQQLDTSGELSDGFNIDALTLCTREHGKVSFSASCMCSVMVW